MLLATSNGLMGASNVKALLGDVQVLWMPCAALARVAG